MILKFETRLCHAVLQSKNQKNMGVALALVNYYSLTPPRKQEPFLDLFPLGQAL
jgi:hypothetical protein